MLRAIFVNREGQLRNGWWIAIFLAVLAALLFPALLLSQRWHHTITLLDQAMIILAATWICQLLRRGPVGEITGIFGLRWLSELLTGGAIGAVLMLVPALFLYAGGWVMWQASNVSLSILGSGLATMAGVAIAEELLFRGFPFQRLIDGAGVWIAQIVIGGFFLLTHLNNPGMTGIVKAWACANIFLASLMFGFAYLRTRSLAMPIGIHFMANVTQGAILGMGVSGNAETGLFAPHFASNAVWLTGGTFGLEASAPGLVCVAIGTALLYRRVRRPVVPAGDAIAV